eukprot:TRINITY_DN13044_c0_g1_i1.p1 TRINITY_DN13044_c0_g1~~TRINITY_DN13044_c0_g1_i1.p1  ORF type:complete len:479 (+),score=115.64 TRINITY_DN13044_c0_g1_i1:33-1469(+)
MLKNLGESDDIFKFRPTDEIHLKLGDCAKSDEVTYLQEFFRFSKADKLKWAFYKNKYEMKSNLIHLSAKEGSIEALKVILAAAKQIKFNVDTPDVNFDTPLILGCVIEDILDGESGEDGKVEGNKAMEARHQIVRQLLDAGADLSIYLKRPTNNPFHWACYFGDLELLKVLMEGSKKMKGNIKHKDIALWFHKNRETQMFPFDYLIQDTTEKAPEHDPKKRARWKARELVATYMIGEYLKGVKERDEQDKKYQAEIARKQRQSVVNKILPFGEGSKSKDVSQEIASNDPEAASPKFKAFSLQLDDHPAPLVEMDTPPKVVSDHNTEEQQALKDSDSTKGLNKAQTLSEAEAIVIPPNEDYIDLRAEMENHMLFYACLKSNEPGEVGSKMREFINKLLPRDGVSPFRPVLPSKDHNAMHALVAVNNQKLLQEILEKNYVYTRKKEFSLREMLNFTSGAGLNSLLHVAKLWVSLSVISKV